jgi:O-antigen/teichoic acid export membrane protein
VSGGHDTARRTSERLVLDRALAHGVAWMGLSKWAAQLLSWAATVIVARILSPADYGIVGMASIYLGFITLVSEFGIDAAVVTLRELPDSVLRQLNSLAVSFGAVAFLISCAVAPLLAKFFNTPELTLVVIAMSGTFVVTGFRVVPQAILLRQLRFRGIAVADAGQAILLSAASVLFAWLGFRYWTLVFGAVIGGVVSTLLILSQARSGFAVPRRRELGAALSFSRNTIVGRMAWYGYDNADFFVAGKVLGKAPLGAYNLAWQLATTIIQKVTSLIGRVTPSVLSAAQTDPAALRRYLLAVTETISLVTVPATVGLALVAHDVVVVAFGEKWLAVVGPLRLLALYAAIRSITPFFAQVLMVTGETARAMRINLVGLVVFPIAFVFGSRWGISGIAAMWIVTHPLVIAWPAGRAVFRRIGLQWAAYLGALLPAATSATVMCAVVILGRSLHPTGLAPIASLAIDVLTGAVAFVAALLALHRNRVARLWSFARTNLLPSRTS